MALPVVDSVGWRDLDLDLTAIVNARVNSTRPNAVLLYFIVPRGSPRLDIDDIRLMEWRDTSAVPGDVWVPADALRGTARIETTVEQSGCASR
ncbi:MAG: hypothetical protein ABI949_17825 [Ilumatobacteraceae bacterium]